MTKRVLAFLMVIAMVFSLIPTVVVAEEAEAPAAFEVIIQRAHNQTSAEGVDVEIYLQAANAATVDTLQVRFTEALSVSSWKDGFQATETEVDETGAALEAPAAILVYPPETEDITEDIVVEAGSKTWLATVHAASVEAVRIAYAEIVLAEDAGFYTTDAADDGTEGYLGAIQETAVSYTETCNHADTAKSWSEFTATAGELAAGNYYLTSDVQLTGLLDVAADAEVTICLNGFTIEDAHNATTRADAKSGGVFYLDSGKTVTLNICDCTASGEGAAYTAGKLLPNGKFGGAIYASAGATVNFYGGIIDGAKSVAAEGSAIFVQDGTLNMFGGKVTGFEGYTSGSTFYGPVMARGSQGTGVINIANVTFVDCGTAILDAPSGGSGKDDKAELTVENVTVQNSRSGAHAIDIKAGRFGKVVIKGDCQFDAPVYVAADEELTLNLGENADIDIVTEAELTEAQFNERVKMAEGGSLPCALLYETAGVFVAYNAETGLFTFQEGHTIDDKHAKGVVFRAWNKTDSLPTEGNWYLLNDVTVDYTKDTVPYIEETLNLDLNGHTVTTTGDNIYRISVGTLNLYDGKSSYDEDGNWLGTGDSQANITGYKTNDRGCITLQTGGTFNFYSGKFSGNSGNNGPVLYMYSTDGDDESRNQNGAVFNMYGGEITENTSTVYGAAISVRDNGSVREGKERAKLNILGGKIYNNTVTGNTAQGNIYAQGDVDITVSGGEISGNEAKDGGAFYLIRNAALNITGGTISGNTASQFGGVVCANGSSTISITGGTITENHANRGGVAYLLGTASVTMDKQTLADGTEIVPEITKNTATSSAGAFFLKETSKLHAAAGKVTENVSDNYGGAIHQNSSTAEVKVTGGQWNYNVAKGTSYGGGLLFADGAGSVSFANAEIKGNSGTYGGAIYTRSDNGITMTNCVLSENTCSKEGAAIYLHTNSDQAILRLTDTVITGNTTTASSAVGAVRIESATTQIVLSGATVIAGNTRNGVASAQMDLFMESSDTKTKFVQVNELSAGAHVNVYYDNATEVPADTLVQIQSGKTQTDWACGWISYFYKDATTSKNVAYRDTNDDKILDTFSYGHYHIGADGNEYELQPWNSATDLPTTAAAEDDLHYYLTSDVTSKAKSVTTGSLELCTNGYNISGTGQMYAVKNAAKLSIVNCTAGYDKNNHLVAGSKISGFHNGTNGGAFVTTGSTDSLLKLSGLEFNGVYDSSTYNKESNYGYGGGVIQSRDANNLIVDGCNFVNCHSGSTGGAINIRYGTNWKARTITNCVFKNNYAGAVGGAIYAQGNGKTTALTVDNCIFDSNYATTINDAATTTAEFTMSGHGGAIYLKNVTGNVTNSEFKNNYVTHREGLTQAATLSGGAIYVYSNAALNMDTATLTAGMETPTGSTFTNNQAVGGFGGAIYGGAACNVDNATFKNNTAARGGVVYQNSGVFTTNNTDFIENTATHSGGALRSAGSTASTCGINATKCDFIGNTAPDGGAVRAEFGQGGFKFYGCNFKENDATTGSGGAFYVNGKSTEVVFDKATDNTACTFTENTAASRGGAIYVYVSAADRVTTCDITGATFNKNTAPDGGAFAANSSPSGATANTTITGSTFTENSATTAGSALSLNGYSTTTLDSCEITNNTDVQFGAIFVQNGNTNVTMTGKMTVMDNANKDYEQANVYMRYDSTAATNIPYVTFTELHPASMIGINTNNDRYANAPVVSEGAVTKSEDFGDNDLNKCFFSGSPERFITHIATVADAEKGIDVGDLILTKFVAEDGTAFGSIDDAMQNVVDSGESEFSFQAGSTEAVTIPDGITSVNLNGATVSEIVVPADKELVLKDTTSDFNTPTEEIVKVKVSGEGTVKSEFESDGKRYMVVKDDEGYASVHRVHLVLSHRLLRPATFGAGFKANFYADEVLSEKVTYGVIFSFNAGAKPSDFENSSTTSWMAADFDVLQPGYESGVKPNQKVLAVTNLLTDNEETNNWNVDLWGVPFVNVGGTITHEEIDGKMYSHISGGTTLYGTPQYVNMKTLAENAFRSGDDTVAKKVADMLIAKGLDGSVFDN